MRRLIACAIFMLCAAPQIAAAGSQTYSSPGTYSFTVPSYGSLTVKVWGGGGGGGSNCAEGYAYGGVPSTAGTASRFGSITANGGGRGIDANVAPACPDTPGAGGTASGGSTNTTGGAGAASLSSSPWTGGAGGNSPSGGAGGAGGVGTGGPGGGPGSGYSGAAPGGGGGGSGSAPGGGGGGYATRTYSQGDLAPGASVTVVVGRGGAGAYADLGFGTIYGGNGASGRVTITWTDAAPTCSVSADTNPLDYGNTTTLHWTSANATTFYINNVGYVTPNQSGSATIGPLATTNYSGTATGPGGTTNCPYTLTVNPPANCTAPWGSTVTHDSSVTAYQSSTVPYGQSCVSETRTCTNGSLSGSYAYVSCEVEEPTVCEPSYSCSGNDIIYTSETCEVTTLASCEAPEFCSPGSAVCLYVAPTGDLTASPRLVPSGGTTRISWSAADAESCTVSGNGDTWTGTSNTRESSPITQFTTYTLTCDDADADAVEDDFTDTVHIYRIPGWFEL